MSASKRAFASDNNAGVHPEILAAIARANDGHALAYGSDEWTARAVDCFKALLGPEIAVYFVFNGTAANVLSIRALTESYHSVICAEGAHIAVDECGAPEKQTGCKLVLVPAPDGKLTVKSVEKHCRGFGNQHHTQPKIISITQASELGTVYTPAEIRELAAFAHAQGMFLHMDGARLANAAASLGVSLREITTDAGVDALSFGGTKNGMMMGEAVVFFGSARREGVDYIRKQNMQLASKMRFIAAQFEALLSNNLWLRNATHSNRMASLLAERIRAIPRIRITQPVEANGIFAIVPRGLIGKLQKRYFFWVWNEESCEVRWMTSFDTTESDIDGFVGAIKEVWESESLGV